MAAALPGENPAWGRAYSLKISTYTFYKPGKQNKNKKKKKTRK